MAEAAGSGTQHVLAQILRQRNYRVPNRNEEKCSKRQQDRAENCTEADEHLTTNCSEDHLHLRLTSEDTLSFVCERECNDNDQMSRLFGRV
ncbi:hypothetical protein GCM10011617_03800 [Novosphingobium arvoryzae]|uniref:Uncharacterized protein n=1 Tax=Novosphingobium arvoryzae TaxID=1256514 RepID=A0A918R706_9SPHN|nr:hypothetical protein GCM10011617_03800 [Novosphingobium arvoryzae]